VPLHRWTLHRLQDASGAFNSFQPHDDIGAMERPQIPEKSASRQRQNLLPSGSFTSFSSVCQPWASPLCLAIRLLASGDMEQNSGHRGGDEVISQKTVLRQINDK